MHKYHFVSKSVAPKRVSEYVLKAFPGLFCLFFFYRRTVCCFGAFAEVANDAIPDVFVVFVVVAVVVVVVAVTVAVAVVVIICLGYYSMICCNISCLF